MKRRGVTVCNCRGENSEAVDTRLMSIMKKRQEGCRDCAESVTLARKELSGRQILNLIKVIIDFQQSPEFEKLSSYHPSVQIRTDLEPDRVHAAQAFNASVY